MAILTSAGITFGDSTTQTTAAVAGVTSLNGQTGAITDTTFGAIGSHYVGSTSAITNAFDGTTRYPPNVTEAGSNLRTNNTNQGAFNFNAVQDAVNNQSAGLSGTWRRLSGGTSQVSGLPNFSITFLYVRVS